MKMIKRFCTGMLSQVLILSVLFSVYSCRDENIITIPGEDIDNGSIIADGTMKFPSGGGYKEIVFETDVDHATLVYTVSSNGSEWCSVGKKNDKLVLNVKINTGDKRLTVLTLSTASGLRQDITINQTEFAYPAPESEADKRIMASSAKVLNGNEELALDVEGKPQPESKDYHPANHAIDGDRSTFYHVEFGIPVSTHPTESKRWPIVLEVGFDNAVETIDYINLVPRSDVTRWGMIGKFNIYVAKGGSTEYTKINSTPYDAGQKDMVTYKVEFAEALKNVTGIRLEIFDGFNDRCSLAEMEFYEKNLENIPYDPSAIFTDGSCSVIKTGVTEDDIANIPSAFYKIIAEGIYNKTYEGGEFRIQEYRPYENPDLSKTRNKVIHAWGYMDNITGMYVENADDVIHVMVGDTHGQDVFLIVQDYTKGWITYKTLLTEGLNSIAPGTKGLCYILMQTTEMLPLHPKTDAEKKTIKDKSVTVHFASGKVNGYYDMEKYKDVSDVEAAKAADQILANAKHPYIDMKGEYTTFAWYTAQFKDNNASLAVTCKHVSEISRLSQEISGLFKYEKGFTTRTCMMPSASGGGSPNATAYRTIFPSNYTGRFVIEESLERLVWGPAHEVGHTAQTNPAFRWAGMGEVGNNLFSIYVKTQMAGLDQSNLLLENYYATARQNIIVTGKPYHETVQLMEKLVPIWQIHLYLAEAKGYTDFYKDLIEHFRITPDIGTTFANSGPLQLDFMRQVCRIGKVNLVGFFQQWGFLTPVDIVMNDYGDRVLKITQADIDALIAEINAMGHPVPAKDITYIKDDNTAEFK